MSRTRDRFARIFAEEGVKIFARICAEDGRVFARETLDRFRQEREAATRRAWTNEVEAVVCGLTDEEMRAYSRASIEPVLLQELARDRPS